MIQDAAVREQALSVTHSFIVQAPAGSGKTELLTQRYLTLLSQVAHEPEGILAITFTRKAAAEMHKRILDALRRAEDQTPPAEAHAHKTWQLAQAVLKRDQLHQWGLLENGHRLKIMTLDGFCAQVTRQLPLLSKMSVDAKVLESPLSFYQQAAQALLSDLEEVEVPWQSALMMVLQHLDNDVGRFKSLCIQMLMRREQWLDVVQRAKSHAALKAALETVLNDMRQETLQKLTHAFPEAHQRDLVDLLRYVQSPISPEQLWEKGRVSAWQWIADWMLTSKGEWRKSLTVKQGFEDKTRKAEMLALMERLDSIQGFLSALQAVQALPPEHFDKNAWPVVEALLTILPVLAAHLTVIFQEQSVVDFNQVALSALGALGAEDAPSDVALSLDAQIQHILVDEFQDTSQLQFRLLRVLTRDWQNGDGRTLFLVGDPMQSIYRFRQADVGLFVKVIEQGIGQLSLTYLTLSANFRADPVLVNWFNMHFPVIFPPISNALTGAVHYAHSVASRAAHAASEIAWIYADNEPTAKKIVQQIQKTLQQYPEDNIAILVRSRTQLVPLFPALQKAQIAYQAIEVESLGDRMVIQDILSLTLALTHLGDRTAWLALLRSPLIGLNLQELLGIAQASVNKTIVEVLNNNDILKNALSRVGREPLRDIVESTWLALSGPASITQEKDLDNIQAFLDVLDQYSNASLNRAAFLQALDRLRANATVAPGTQVQVMTIHKSKGLEFDTVILPDLSSGSATDDPPLLLWHEFLLAPIPSAKTEEKDPIYQYLWELNQQRAAYELQRLLYVAVTRAKKRLYLGARREINEVGEIKAARKGSFLKLFAL